MLKNMKLRTLMPVLDEYKKSFKYRTKYQVSPAHNLLQGRIIPFPAATVARVSLINISRMVCT